ncbi:hypothetical protein BDB01DRAFT_784249 [Pilobolus umbonatus]|nr:hypothetical protein BDB01DRAFT_784249 [Pilobolus umbonatus]
MSEPLNKIDTDIPKPTSPRHDLLDDNTLNTDTLPGPLQHLKEAFPDIDLDIIESIYNTHGKNVDSTFEVLLSMSDPTYKPEPVAKTQLQRDEEYARRLAREGEVHHPQHVPGENQPLFNYKEELPIIKGKVIEAGTAAKNKLMSLYNSFVSGPSNENKKTKATSGGLVESNLGGFSMPNTVERRSPPHESHTTPIKNPLHGNKDKIVTSTSRDQILSDEEFARQLAREETEAMEAAALVEANHPSTARSPVQLDHISEEVSFTGNDNDSNINTTSNDTIGYTIREHDDLDDLFDKKVSLKDANDNKKD